MGKDENVVGYVSKVHNLIHLIKGYGEIKSDRMVINKVMIILTSHFDHVIMTIQEASNLERLKLEGVVGSLRLMN